jgi:Flp pilus assembly pilin Flp
LLALIALVVIGIVAVMGQTVSSLWYQRIIDSWPS